MHGRATCKQLSIVLPVDIQPMWLHILHMYTEMNNRNCEHIKSCKYQDLSNLLTNLNIISLWDFTTVPSFIVKRTSFFNLLVGLVKEEFLLVFGDRMTANFEMAEQWQTAGVSFLNSLIASFDLFCHSCSCFFNIMCRVASLYNVGHNG